jgi:hypothetical protein
VTLDFALQPPVFAIVRLDPRSAIPAWATSGAFFSITRTGAELSILCEESNVPADCGDVARGWRAFALRGPFAFTELGIAAEFTSVLAKSGISVLVVSTYDTDWVFVPGARVEAAARALIAAGHRVVS